LQNWFQFCEFGLLNFPLRFDTSGKSAAWWHHRKNFEEPAPEDGRGLFVSRIERAAARHGATSFERTLPGRRKRAAVRASMTP
jgi:hypothetical protein